MGLNMIVTVKQVPDTKNVSGQAMKPDGTVNRAALPAVFNPEDLNALEAALNIKETLGGHVTVVTMGPPKAVDVLKECLYRGADDVILLSDRRFAGADTLATSYTLKCAVEKIGNYDLILCGRQAIDGDTAQVGPQIAEKLKINQLTGVAEFLSVTPESISVRRSTDSGYEIAKSGFPVLCTVTAEANVPRPPSIKKVMIFKDIAARNGEPYDETYIDRVRPDILNHVKEWNLDSLGADPERCGLSGSPTRVKKIESVVLSTRETRIVPNSDEGISDLVHELVKEHILG